MKHEIHISDVRTFRQCRRRWYFSSQMALNLEPAIPYAPFFTGRAIHYALEQYYKKGSSLTDSAMSFIRDETQKWGTLWESEREKLVDQIGLIMGMLTHYGLWVDKLEGRWADSNLEFLALETSFSVPLYNPDTFRKSSKVYLAGRFDGVVINKADGTYWLWEIKTTRSINELYRSLVLDEQCGTYIYAAQQTFKVPISGVLYTIMRKKAPTEPRVLQSGMLSKDQRIDTTAEAYLAAIKSNHPDMTLEEIYANYGDILRHLLDVGNNFFARVPIYRTKKEIDTLSSHIWSTALEMTRSTTTLYPSPGWSTCNFCPFRSPCVAMNAGADYQMILDAEFRSRITERETEEDETV